MLYIPIKNMDGQWTLHHANSRGLLPSELKDKTVPIYIHAVHFMAIKLVNLFK